MNKRILIVDDQTDFKVLKWAFSQHDLLLVTDPLQAVRAAKDFHPHLFLLDLVRPNMDGAALAAKIREEPCLKNVPIVFISALVHSQDDAKDPVLIHGYSALGKPFRIATLRRCVEQHLGLLDSSVSGVQRVVNGFLAGS